MPGKPYDNILNCIHGKFFAMCHVCAQFRLTAGTMYEGVDDLEPLFMDTNVFERPRKDGFTKFETRVFEELLGAPGSKGLTFAERMALLEAMREGALWMLARIEENK